MRIEIHKVREVLKAHIYAAEAVGKSEVAFSLMEALTAIEQEFNWPQAEREES